MKKLISQTLTTQAILLVVCFTSIPVFPLFSFAADPISYQVPHNPPACSSIRVRNEVPTLDLSSFSMESELTDACPINAAEPPLSRSNRSALQGVSGAIDGNGDIAQKVQIQVISPPEDARIPGQVEDWVSQLLKASPGHGISLTFCAKSKDDACVGKPTRVLVEGSREVCCTEECRPGDFHLQWNIRQHNRPAQWMMAAPLIDSAKKFAGSLAYLSPCRAKDSRCEKAVDAQTGAEFLSYLTHNLSLTKDLSFTQKKRAVMKSFFDVAAKVGNVGSVRWLKQVGADVPRSEQNLGHIVEEVSKSSDLGMSLWLHDNGIDLQKSKFPSYNEGLEYLAQVFNNREIKADPEKRDTSHFLESARLMEKALRELNQGEDPNVPAPGRLETIQWLLEHGSTLNDSSAISAALAQLPLSYRQILTEYVVDHLGHRNLRGFYVDFIILFHLPTGFDPHFARAIFGKLYPDEKAKLFNHALTSEDPQLLEFFLDQADPLQVSRWQQELPRSAGRLDLKANLLRVALRKNKGALVKLLTGSTAPSLLPDLLNQRDEEQGQTVLHVAAAQNRLKQDRGSPVVTLAQLSEMVMRGAKYSAKDSHGNLALDAEQLDAIIRHSIDQNDASLLSRLQADGFSRQATAVVGAKNQQAFLHHAAEKGQLKVLSYLAHEKSTLDLPDEHGHTALYNALQNKDRKVVDLLARAGATVDAGILKQVVATRDPQLFETFRQATQFKYDARIFSQVGEKASLPVAEFLLDSRLSAGEKEPLRRRVKELKKIPQKTGTIDGAIAAGDLRSFVAFVQRGAKIEVTQENQLTSEMLTFLLSQSAKQGDLAQVQHWVIGGANPLRKDQSGLTPLEQAQSQKLHKSNEVINYLKAEAKKAARQAAK